MNDIEIKLTWHAIERIKERAGLNCTEFKLAYKNSPKKMLTRKTKLRAKELKNMINMYVIHVKSLNLLLLGVDVYDEEYLLIVTVVKNKPEKLNRKRRS